MRARSSQGFTLLELSIVLALIGVILGIAMATFTASLQASQYNKTVARMDEIEKVLLNYAIANNRIPCPSDLTQIPTSTTYGYEAGATAGGTGTGECVTGMTPAANFKSASGAEEGGVPTRALQLPDDYLYDGWGRRFRYAVDPTYTKSSALPVAASCGSGFTADVSAITVNDASGAARTTAGMYVLMSHGANGHGAYTSNGVVLNAGSVNANELSNCHCTSAGAYSGTYTPTYVEKVPTQDPANALDNFDDIVTFKEPWQMQALNYPLTAASCTQYIYVVDQNNYRVEVFNTSGTYLSQFGTSGNGLYHPSDIAIDSSGNLWVTDDNNNRVQKFNSSGTWLASLGGTSSACTTNCLCTSGTCPSSSGSGNGQFSQPQGARLDSSGNIWVADESNGRVEEFNSGGTYLSQFSTSSKIGAANELAIDSGNNVWVSGANNAEMGKWNSSEVYQSTITLNGGSAKANYIAFDASGNIYVTDQGNNVVQKFNSSGTYLSSFASSGSGNGQLSGPNAIAIDSSGNFWVADGNNNRVEEFNSSSTFLMSIGGTASACTNCACTSGTCPTSSGSGNGQFNVPAGLAIGSR